jgi:uncharacterized protein (DUF1499 family)
MATPARRSVTGAKQGLSTAGAFIADSVRLTPSSSYPNCVSSTWMTIAWTSK